MKKGLDKRKYRVQIAVMIFKGRLLKVGETLECHRAHVGTFLSVHWKVTVVVAAGDRWLSICRSRLSSQWRPELGQALPACVGDWSSEMHGPCSSLLMAGPKCQV